MSLMTTNAARSFILPAITVVHVLMMPPRKPREQSLAAKSGLPSEAPGQNVQPDYPQFLKECFQTLSCTTAITKLEIKFKYTNVRTISQQLLHPDRCAHQVVGH